MEKFTATIGIIGVNPFVLLPEKALHNIFVAAGKDKGPVQVRGTIDGHAFIQTLVKFSGDWRLYVNMPMLKASGKKVGDKVKMTVEFDPAERTIAMHPEFEAALKKNPEARKVFDQLSPSRRKEIVRYIANLKSGEAVERNVKRAIGFLLNKERFVGRDNP